MYNNRDKKLKRLYYLETHKERMLAAALYRAKRYKLPFNIELKDIIIPKYCPLLGVALIIAEGRPKQNSPSLDRIVPKHGYVVGNIQVISFKANTMKGNATREQLIQFANWILQEYNV